MKTPPLNMVFSLSPKQEPLIHTLDNSVLVIMRISRKDEDKIFVWIMLNCYPAEPPDHTGTALDSFPDLWHSLKLYLCCFLEALLNNASLPMQRMPQR